MERRDMVLAATGCCAGWDSVVQQQGLYTARSHLFLILELRLVMGRCLRYFQIIETILSPPHVHAHARACTSRSAMLVTAGASRSITVILLGIPIYSKLKFGSS